MMGEHERRTEDEVLDEQKADAVEDLEVQDAQASDVHGGLTEGEPTPTESLSLNFKK
jgi:hypothetical protein